jgi:hypothetical protein
MSMELYILADKQLSAMDVWQKALDTAGSPLQLPMTFSLARGGVLPAKFKDKTTAFECARWNAAEMAEISDINFGRRWTYALVLRWGGDPYAGIAAYMAGAAYANATNGVLLDCEENKIITPARATEIALEIEQFVPDIERVVQKALERFRK